MSSSAGEYVNTGNATSSNYGTSIKQKNELGKAEQRVEITLQQAEMHTRHQE